MVVVNHRELLLLLVVELVRRHLVGIVEPLDLLRTVHLRERHLVEGLGVLLTVVVRVEGTLEAWVLWHHGPEVGRAGKVLIWELLL